MNYGDHNCI